MPGLFTSVGFRRLGASLVGAVLIAAASLAAASAGSLSITVEGLHSNRGKLLFALFDQPSHWPDSDQADYNAAVPATRGAVDFTFRNLKPGLYALGGFHDENGNGKLDTNFLGIPVEGYFVSRDPTILFSPPSFDSVAVRVGTGDTHIVVHLKY